MKLQIAHEFQCTPETFWQKLFLDAEFNSWLYLEKLRFPEYRVLEEKEQGGNLVRRVSVKPPQNAPAVVQKLVGDGFSYVEAGTFDRAKQTYRFHVEPSAMGDKIRTEGEMRCLPLGDARCRRTLDMTIAVKVFGVGGIVEGFIAKSTQDSYEQAAKYTAEWLKLKGL